MNYLQYRIFAMFLISFSVLLSSVVWWSNTLVPSAVDKHVYKTSRSVEENGDNDGTLSQGDDRKSTIQNPVVAAEQSLTAFEIDTQFHSLLRAPKETDVELSYPVSASEDYDRRVVGEIAIFYNLYVANESDITRVRGFVTEQLGLRDHRYHGEIFVNSIGIPVPIPNTTLLQHYESANEEVTLHSLWEYCRFNRNSKVIYLHSKGSHHSYEGKNDLLRLFLSRGALSEECTNLPKSCNVCSSRMSALPHPHTPGNMWLARCEYIQLLSDPSAFRSKMDTMRRFMPRVWFKVKQPWCYGLDRFSAEHWVHSHPSVQPCDLYEDQEYVSDPYLVFGIPSQSHFTPCGIPFALTTPTLT